MSDRWMGPVGCVWRGTEPVQQPGFVDVTHEQEQDMKQDRFEAERTQAGGRAKERWGSRTNDPKRELAAGHHQHADRIQERQKLSNDEAARELKDFFDSHPISLQMAAA